MACALSPSKGAAGKARLDLFRFARWHTKKRDSWGERFLPSSSRGNRRPHFGRKRRNFDGANSLPPTHVLRRFLGTAPGPCGHLPSAGGLSTPLAVAGVSQVFASGHSRSTLVVILSRLSCLVPLTTAFVRPVTERQSTTGAMKAPEGNSSIGRASVSKTEGWGFKSLLPCRLEASRLRHGRS